MGCSRKQAEIEFGVYSFVVCRGEPHCSPQISGQTRGSAPTFITHLNLLYRYFSRYLSHIGYGHCRGIFTEKGIYQALGCGAVVQNSDDI
jgi:hypothetical protein